MAYNSPNDQRRQTTPRKYQGRAGESRSANQGSSGTRRVQARGGSSSQYRSHNRSRSKGRSGYSLNNGGVRLGGRRGGLVNQAMSDPRLFVLLVIAFVLFVAILIGLLNLVRGCVSTRMEKRNADEQDTRVSLAVSSSMAERLTEVLDRNELFAQIAQDADAIGDSRLLELAMREPTAIEFVAGYLSSDTPKTAQPFDGSASTGYYPTLYTWDSRWGYVSYGGAPLALTGSGPVSLSMAYMGLTGKTDQTPDVLAAKATTAEQTDDVYGTSEEFFVDVASSLGLELDEYSASADNLSELLQSGTVILVQLHERSLTDEAHWALAVSRNLDGSINLYDPTSTAVTEHPWDPATIASGADAFFSLTKASSESDD